MVSDKRFVVETVEITDCDTDVSRIAKVITDTKETYSYEDLEEIVDLLNEQQATINELQGQINRLNYIIEELRKNNYNKFELINKMKKEEKLYAEEIVRLNNEIGELRETNKEWLQFKSLGGDY